MFENELRNLITQIVQKEEKMEGYRQLLNEQIQFNVKDLYVEVCGRSAMATAYHLHLFLHQNQSGGDLRSLESVIKGYNNCTSMNLTFMEFSLIFLSKHNKLLAKLALQRDSQGNMPNYLLDYARKIIEIQCQLHTKFIQFRNLYSAEAQQWIKNHIQINVQQNCESINTVKFSTLFPLNQDQLEHLIGYLSPTKQQSISRDKMLSIFTLKNCTSVEKYLKATKKRKQHNKKFNDPGEQIDPLIRPEFHDCLQRPKTTQLFSFRQVKSIQKHLDRLNSKNKNELTEKIGRYRKMVEKQLVETCQTIKQIIWLEKQIQYQRIQLCLCPDFYPVLFFESMVRDRSGLLIPSLMQDYLSKMGIPIVLEELYLLFKRFTNRADGKLHFNEFCSIFDVCCSDYIRIQKNREVKGLQDVELTTKKQFLKLIKLIVKNQMKAEKLKAKLNKNNINLRDVFSVFDADEDGFISQLDFKIAWKKFLLMDLPKPQIQLFWFRMKVDPNSDTMIKYDRFVTQLLPKCKWVSKSKNRSKQKQKGRK